MFPTPGSTAITNKHCFYGRCKRMLCSALKLLCEGSGDTMKEKDQWILVFDSGLGGISVLRELVKILPGERFLYYGDSQNAPYGIRPTDEVCKLTTEAVKAMMPRGVKAVVIACNTATSAAIDLLRKSYPDKIVVGIEPALKLAADRHPGGRIAVMATNVTLRETKFCALMERFSQKNRVVPLPCPGLVEFVEQGILDSPALRQHLKELLRPVMGAGLDAVVLGCTHFPFLRPAIQELLGPRVEILDGGAGTAAQTRNRLEAQNLLRRAPDGTVELCNSLGTPEILKRSTQLLEMEL